MKLKLITVLLLSAVLSACAEDKEPADAADAPSLQPDATINGVWEYTDANGQCAAGELFGDSSQGCVKFIQLITFTDGSAYYFLSMGHGFLWDVSGWLAPNTTAFEKPYLFGSTTYDLIGDLSTATPSFSVKYDNDADLLDTAAKSFTLIAQ